ncbi:MAG: SGNH/GDSL hydrolase family protein [Spirochaetales bacterium]|nr:SGNH/GDSL hydrolase family protein [Spirochaetales bacterium]
MKNIVCFGDSNTWGYNPQMGERYPYENRWTTILEEGLYFAEDKAIYKIIPEGLNGRTTTFEDPVEGDKCGIRHLPVILESHKPIDLLIIMLGTNDLKSRFSVNAQEIAGSAGRLVDLALNSGSSPAKNSPRIILISPPPVIEAERFAYAFSGAAEKSKGLAKAYEALAEEKGVYFLDAGTVVKSSIYDGIHWDAEYHKEFAIAVAEKVLKIFG